MKIEAFLLLAFVLRIANIKSFNFFNDYDAKLFKIFNDSSLYVLWLSSLVKSFSCRKIHFLRNSLNELIIPSNKRTFSNLIIVYLSFRFPSLQLYRLTRKYEWPNGKNFVHPWKLFMTFETQQGEDITFFRNPLSMLIL